MNAGNSTKVTAQQCMQGVIDYLAKPLLMDRYSKTKLRREIRFTISGILGSVMSEETENNSKDVLLDQYQRCAMCPTKKDRKTKTCCSACKRPICKDHCSGLCTECGFI